MLLGTVIIAKIAYYIIKKYVQALTAKTQTDLDDLLLKSLEKPFVFFILIIGLNISVNTLTLSTSISSVFSNLIMVLLTLNAAAVVAAIVDVLFEKFIIPITKKSESKLDDQLVPMFKNGARIIVFVFAILTIVTNFGYDITAVLGGLGIAGLAVAMAAQDTLGNVIGSAAIITDRPFETEDTIKVNGYIGKVEEIGMRSTRIRTLDGTLVAIPNSTIAKSEIENFTKSNKRRVQVKLGLEYGTSAKKMNKAKSELVDVVKSTRGTDPDDIKVQFLEFGESTLQLVLTYQVLETSKLLDIQDEVNMKIKERFDSEKIGFAFPTRTIIVKD
jgi:MscS family membrane protein